MHTAAYRSKHTYLCRAGVGSSAVWLSPNLPMTSELCGRANSGIEVAKDNHLLLLLECKDVLHQRCIVLLLPWVACTRIPHTGSVPPRGQRHKATDSLAVLQSATRSSGQGTQYRPYSCQLWDYQTICNPAHLYVRHPPHVILNSNNMLPILPQNTPNLKLLPCTSQSLNIPCAQGKASPSQGVRRAQGD